MAQLTLSERNTFAQNEVFKGRVFQGLFSKANFHKNVSPIDTLEKQKQNTYAKSFVIGGANAIDLPACVRFWLANYNADPAALIVTEGDPLIGQPTDSAILDTSALDTVYNSLAGVIAGDDGQAPV